MTELRRDCRWFVRIGSAPHCRRGMFASPKAAPERLDLGCRCDPITEYCPIDGKADVLTDPSEAGDPPWKIEEWEDDA